MLCRSPAPADLGFALERLATAEPALDPEGCIRPEQGGASITLNIAGTDPCGAQSNYFQTSTSVWPRSSGDKTLPGWIVL